MTPTCPVAIASPTCSWPCAPTNLPGGDRIAHLLLALRADEEGFATVANRAFAGARWRLRRRLDAPVRPALDHAAQQARG